MCSTSPINCPQSLRQHTEKNKMWQCNLLERECNSQYGLKGHQLTTPQWHRPRGGSPLIPQIDTLHSSVASRMCSVVLCPCYRDRVLKVPTSYAGTQHLATVHSSLPNLQLFVKMPGMNIAQAQMDSAHRHAQKCS